MAIIYHLSWVMSTVLVEFFQLGVKKMYEKYEKLLEERGVKTSAVAKATGIDKGTFSHWKSGKYTPKSDKIQKIADFFGVPVTYFYEADIDYLDSAEKHVDTLDALADVLKTDEELKDHTFTPEQLEQILDYAKFIARK